MNRDPEHLRQRLEQLRQQFAALLPDRLTAITDQWASMTEGQLAEADLRHLGLAAHTLKGSAATYGFVATSEAAGQLEQALDALLEGPIADHSRAKEMIGTLLDKLKNAKGLQKIEFQSTAANRHEKRGGEAKKTERTIYVLEDDPVIRALLSTQLGHYGYAVSSFDDPALFRAAAVADPPDAMIIDIVLVPSGPTGLDILVELRKSTGIDVPALIATVRTDLDARVAAVRAGAAAYFTKPIDIPELVAALDRLTGDETAEPYRILIVDDDASIATYHGEVLRFADMETRIATTPEAALEQLNEFHPDLLLLDMYMPRVSGPDLASVIRQQPSAAGLPIVFLSTEQDPDKQLATIIGGADDFLVKPIEPNRLISSITARAERSRLLRSKTIQDPMTKLLNHTATKDRLSTELARAKRYNTPLVFALIDIDLFKRVNDTYGHPVGDSVIWGLARLLRQRLRQFDAIGRYGGEEFGVIMPQTSLAQAVIVLDDLRQHFSALEFLADDIRFCMTFSCGAVAATATDQTVDLIRAADEALYTAKRNGRDKVCAA